MNKFFKCYSDDNNDELIISESEINKIIPIKDKDNNVKLIVEYYDREFCVNTVYVCDYITPYNVN